MYKVSYRKLYKISKKASEECDCEIPGYHSLLL